MAGQPSEVVDEFGIGLVVRRHGWSYLKLVTPERDFACHVSDVFCDVNITLIDLCSALIENQAFEAKFYDKPGGHIWALAPVAARQHTMRFRVYEIGNRRIGSEYLRTDLQLLIEFDVKRQQLATMLIGELWKAAMFNREPSYQKERESFPFENYLRLRRRWERWASGQDQLPSSD